MESVFYHFVALAAVQEKEAEVTELVEKNEGEIRGWYIPHLSNQTIFATAFPHTTERDSNPEDQSATLQMML